VYNFFISYYAVLFRSFLRYVYNVSKILILLIIFIFSNNSFESVLLIVSTINICTKFKGANFFQHIYNKYVFIYLVYLYSLFLFFLTHKHSPLF